MTDEVAFIGDLHADYDAYLKAISTAQYSVQVGDFGMGFLSRAEEAAMRLDVNQGQHGFIRGNHDDPELCKTFPHFIPDGSYNPAWDTFFVGGAWSIDRDQRRAGVDWWSDEEVSSDQWGQIIKSYQAVKPSVVVTHDCPFSVARELFSSVIPYPVRLTLTSYALDIMLDAHQPDLWIFGHWHYPCIKKIGRTKFHCLGINDVCKYNLGAAR